MVRYGAFGVLAYLYTLAACFTHKIPELMILKGRRPPGPHIAGSARATDRPTDRSRKV